MSTRIRPKKRKRQTQSSRLYLRDHDHRDVIYNDKYINALWMKKDGKDELVWVKYPHRSVIGYWYEGGTYDRGYFGNINLDLGIGHWSLAVSGQREHTLRKVGDLILSIYSYSSSSVVVTDDGCVWHTIKSVPYCDDDYNFIDGCLLNYSATLLSYSTWEYRINIRVLKFYKDETTNNWTYKTFSNSFIQKYANYTCPLGLCKDGLLIGRQWNSNEDGVIYKVKSDGTQEYVGPFPYRGYPLSRGSIFDGNYTCYDSNEDLTTQVFLTMGEDEPQTNYKRCSFVVHATHDGGLTWTHNTLFQVTRYYYYWYGMSTHRAELSYKNKSFNFFIVDPTNNKCHMYTSKTGDSWSEVSLPEYIDIDIIGGQGSKFVKEPTYDKIRLHFVTIDSNVSDVYPNLYFYASINYISNTNSGNYYHFGGEGPYNMMCKDGKVANAKLENFLCFALSGYVVYLNSVIPKSSSDNYAIQVQSHNESVGAEEIVEGDYVLGNNTVESEVENV